MTGHGAVPVPFITLGAAETLIDVEVVRNSHGVGIAFADESAHDRDSRGVLWDRRLTLPVDRRGRPDFSGVHPVRQRRVMLRLLCQVCGGPSDRTDEGTLWLLPAGPSAKPPAPGSSGQEFTPHPPVCLSCAPLAVRFCRPLREGFTALRVKDVEFAGVFGQVYEPDVFGRLQRRSSAFVEYGDRRTRWTVAAQQCAVLLGTTEVDLATEVAKR